MFTSPFWGLGCLLAGCGAAYVLRRMPPSACFHAGRHRNLDGLRGVLALIMFICHASTWQQYLADHRWRVSETPVYIIPGQTGIVIFFMLTGFLFARKFLATGRRSENWIRLYVSRFLRLVPAYYLMLSALLVVLVVQLLKGNARWEDCRWSDALAWLAFTVPGAPLMCGYELTNIAVAGVTWSLTYEWAFYFGLPFLAVLIGKRVPWVVLGLCGIALFVAVRAVPMYLVVYLSFAMGILSALLDWFRPSVWLQTSSWAGILAVVLLFVNAFLHSQTSYVVGSVFLISIAFHVFASGNSLKGILNTRTFQVFGLCTYSLYLFHGLLLYVAFLTLSEFYPAFFSNDLIYWVVVMLLTPVLIGVSLFLYLTIEHPPMQRVLQVSAAIERFLVRGRARDSDTHLPIK